MNRECRKCKSIFPATAEYYNTSKRCLLGLVSICKICVSIYNKARRNTDKYRHRQKLYARIYRAKNPENTKIINTKSRNKNKDNYNEKRNLKYKTDTKYRDRKDRCQKIYRNSEKGQSMLNKPKNKKNAILRARKYREKNAEKIKLQMKEYRENNRLYLNEKDRIRRLEINDNYIATVMRRHIKDLTPEIIETKRLVIQLKRELKK